MFTKARFFSFLLLLFSLAVDGQAGAEEQTRLTITGSSTVAPLVSEIAKRYEREHGNIRIDVQTGGSSRGLADVRRGLSDIGMMSRALGSDGSDLDAFTIASDGIALITHADNPVERIASDGIRAIYLGEATNWSRFGGADRDIVVINKAAGRATLDVFLQHFQLDDRQIKAQIIAGENQQVIKTVAGNPAAIGYVSIGAAVEESRLGVPIRMLGFDDVMPAPANVVNGSYPITRPLQLIVRSGSSDDVMAFIRYSQSAAVRDLVEGARFVYMQN
ncbi:MAG: phosphate ABC transporter substrate-binding protein [Aquisalimonadaceae bacterium]